MRRAECGAGPYAVFLPNRLNATEPQAATQVVLLLACSPFLLRPVLDLQTLHAPEVFGIVGDDRRSDGSCMCGNHQVSRTELSAALLEVKANFSVVLSRLLRPIEHREVQDQAIENGLILLALRTSRSLYAIRQFRIGHG